MTFSASAALCIFLGELVLRWNGSIAPRTATFGARGYIFKVEGA